MLNDEIKDCKQRKHALRRYYVNFIVLHFVQSLMSLNSTNSDFFNTGTFIENRVRVLPRLMIDRVTSVKI